MDRLRPIIATAMVAMAVACGCSSSPWSTKQTAARPAAPPQGQLPAHPSGPSDPQALQQMMAELDRLQVLDPAARQRLLTDLQQTDPQLRPLVIEQFRATLAYRRQMEQREAALASGQPGTQGPVAARPSVGRDVLPQDPGYSAPANPSASRQSSGVSNAPWPGPQPWPSTGEVPQQRPEPTPGGGGPGPLPQSSGTMSANRPVAGLAQCGDAEPAALRNPLLEGRSSDVSQSAVRLASYVSDRAPADDWREHLTATIRSLESSLAGVPPSADDPSRQARLRMLYLLADRREDALRPIPAGTSSKHDEQEFWSNELYGLAVWLDSQRITDSQRRAEEAKRHLGKAVARLAAISPLVVRNLALVTDIQSFGNYKPCKKAEFAPEQDILLYAEVENLSCEETPKGYHSAWRSSCQIFDSRGQRVVAHEPTASEEYCQNPRRDFFIGCQFRLPKRIYSGKHTLQIMVEDVKSQKAGQSSIEFTLKAAE